MASIEVTPPTTGAHTKFDPVWSVWLDIEVTPPTTGGHTKFDLRKHGFRHVGLVRGARG